MIWQSTLFSSPYVVILIVTTMPWITVGCSRSDVDQTTTDTNAQTQSSTDPVGKIRLDFAPPVELSNAKLTLIRFLDGRPSVVQIANYDIEQNEHEYPAVLFHGTTTATNSISLSGQTIECRMYYQQSFSALVALTRPGETAMLTFGPFDNLRRSLSGSLQPVELISSDNQIIPVAGGKLTTTVRDWNP
jgi:hypothetical protein